MPQSPMISPRYRGFSIIELLIATSLSVIILTQALGLIIQHIRTQIELTQQTMAEQEVWRALGLVEDELARTAFSTAQRGVENPYRLLVRKNCVLSGYDRNSNGIASYDDNDFFGFRIKSGVLQYSNSAVNCESGYWESLSNKHIVTLGELSIQSIQDQQLCLNLSHTPPTQCNPHHCNFVPFTTGDRLAKKMSLSLKVTFVTKPTGRHVQLERRVVIQNPVIETASSDSNDIDVCANV